MTEFFLSQCWELSIRLPEFGAAINDRFVANAARFPPFLHYFFTIFHSLFDFAYYCNHSTRIRTRLKRRNIGAFLAFRRP